MYVLNDVVEWEIVIFLNDESVIHLNEAFDN